MGSQQNRFPLQHERRKRWGGCFGALSCFRTQKGGKRIAPTSRVVEGNSTAAQSNGPHVTGSANQVAIPGSHILAPPSSPASFSNSALPSTAPSPNCFLSANSPGGPTSTMFATGPYAHETQLVSPPVFSAFTTEPSTAPLTPPPELAHLTTPSSPDVPFARFFASSADLRSAEKTKGVTGSEFQSTYSPYPGSPASSVISPISRASGEYISSSYPERQFAPQWDQSVSSQNGKYQRTDSGRLFVQDTDSASMVSRDTNFFCPATFAQYYLDPSSTNGGRLSVSKDSDVHPAAGSGHQNRQNRSPKQDAEELEAYRASFGFSADEIITTPQYVEISNVMDESFTMSPCASNKVAPEETLELPSANEGQKPLRIKTQASAQNDTDMKSDFADGCEIRPRDRYEDLKFRRQSSKTARSATQADHALDDDTENILSKFSSSKISRKYQVGLSCSDAEVEYRRGRSLRESKSNSAWQD